MIDTEKMVSELKSGSLKGIAAMQILAKEGVEFICGAGTGGSGKDLQFDLLEAVLVHNDVLVAHVSTSAAIKCHMNKDGENNNALGESLRLAKDNEARGTLFPDEPTLAALACDILALRQKGFTKMLVSGFPRGEKQPAKVMSLKGAKIYHYGIGLRTALERAKHRTEQRKKKGLLPREDDRLSTVHYRFKLHQNQTIPELRKIDRQFPFRINWLDGSQPVAAVLHDSLEAMGCNARLVDDCLSTLERQEGGVHEIMRAAGMIETKLRTSEGGRPVSQSRPPTINSTLMTTTPSVDPDSKWAMFWKNKSVVRGDAQPA